VTVVVAVVLDRVAVHGNGGGRTHNLLVNSVSKVKKEEKKIYLGSRHLCASSPCPCPCRLLLLPRPLVLRVGAGVGGKWW